MKKLVCLLLCAALLLTAAGCSIKEPSPESTEAPTQGVVEVYMADRETQLKYEDVQLQYWSLLSETDAEAEVLRQAAQVFERTTGAVVSLNWLGGDEIQLVEILSGGQADIFETPGASLQQFFSSYALDLTELAAKAEYETQSWEVLRQQIMDRYGSLKAIAYRPYLYGMYYNREAFEKLGVESAPSSWGDYLNFCQMLKDNGYEGLVIDQERANLVLELHMERALGWDGLRETMVGAQWRKNDMALTMIQEAISFAEKDYLVKGTPTAFPGGQNRLGQSNAVFVAGSNITCGEVERACLADMKWGVFPYPGDGPGTGLLVDADVLAVNVSCPEPEAAFDFIMLLTAGEFDQLRADVAVSIPADPDNTSVIAGANACMASATAQAPKWFTPDNNELFCRLWNGYYKTGAYFANQLNTLAQKFESEQSVG